jgi:hypothetical protein
MSPLAESLQKSKIAIVWRVLWRAFPKFSARRSPVFFCRNGAVLWSQGFGRVAYVLGARSVQIGWGIGESPNQRRLLLSHVSQWDSPDQEQKVSEEELEQIRLCLLEKYTAMGESVQFQ